MTPQQDLWVDRRDGDDLVDAWVVGRGGMLGRQVESTLASQGRRVWVPPGRVPWESEQVQSALTAAARAFLTHGSGAWTVYWCAGAGVTATRKELLEREVLVFEQLLADLARHGDAPGGTLVLASSAGGLYAGSSPPPFDEAVPPRPLAPYGHAKLAMEEAARTWASSSGGRVLVGRIANLYGPGQDVNKPQGLISQLVRAHLVREPLQVYVPLDTTRDYVYVVDAAQRLVSAGSRAQGQPSGSAVTKIIASERGLTIGAILGELHRVLRKRPQIVLGSSPVSRFQARDLRLRSTVWADLDTTPLTPLPVGILATLRDLTRQVQEGRLRPAS